MKTEGSLPHYPQQFLLDSQLLTKTSMYTIQPISAHSYRNSSYLCRYFLNHWLF